VESQLEACAAVSSA